MDKKIFWAFFFLIIIFGLIIRLLPTLDNNFYFTMDQADEAVRSRELWFRHTIPLTGQGTSLEGIYHGPFWIWYISLGYLLFLGHPAGALFMLKILKLSVLAFLMYRLSRNVSPWIALIAGAALQFFWPFYDASRFAFSPFPLVSAAIATILLLTEGQGTKQRLFVLSAVPVGMVWHTELASFPPFFALCTIVGFWAVVKKRLSWENYLFYFLLVFLFFIPHLITEVTSNFPQTAALKKHIFSPTGVFERTNGNLISKVFIDSFAQSITPVRPLTLIGAVLAAVLMVFINLKKYTAKSPNQLSRGFLFSQRLIAVTFLLFTLSWIWFSASSGWNPWHTVYLAPTLYIAVLLGIWTLPKKISVVIFAIVASSQITIFTKNYQTFFKPSDDASLLTNELAAVDWVYGQSGDKGFYVYSYLPSVYDYPYQYLFWWRGRGKYGYVPCEYSTFPKSPSFFVPGLEFYQEPKRGCQNIRFLIVEPDKKTQNQSRWLEQVRMGTKLEKEAYFGNILVEKRTF